MGKKIISLLFMLVILTVGIGSAINARADIAAFLKGHSFDKESISGLDSQFTENILARSGWIDINGAFYRAIGGTYIKDPGNRDVYKLKNGTLSYVLRKQDMTDYAEKIQELSEMTSAGGADFLYVQLPSKIMNSDLFEAGVRDYGNPNADALVQKLRDMKVPVLSLREHISAEDQAGTDLFFRTDHHWLPQTALWAAGKIASECSERYGYSCDEQVFDLANYDIKTYPGWFLGSIGKRAGATYAGTDDFDLLIPKEETSFVFDAESKEHIHREGDFEEALLQKELLEKKDYYDINCYVTYIGGDYGINTVVNELCANDTSVLLLRDSFSCALEPFLCMNYKQVTAIDLRHYEGPDLPQLLAEGSYDLVLLAYCPHSFSPKQFVFTGEDE